MDTDRQQSTDPLVVQVALEHLFPAKGEGAVDFYVKGASINAVQSWCDEHWPCSLGYGANADSFTSDQTRPHVRWDY